LEYPSTAPNSPTSTHFVRRAMQANKKQQKTMAYQMSFSSLSPFSSLIGGDYRHKIAFFCFVFSPLDS
jgi:hypothetical protein